MRIALAEGRRLRLALVREDLELPFLDDLVELAGFLLPALEELVVPDVELVCLPEEFAAEVESED